MKTTILNKLFLAVVFAAMLSISSCKNNETEGNVVGEPSQVDTYSQETEQAADTTSRTEEDSIMETPSP